MRQQQQPVPVNERLQVLLLLLDTLLLSLLLLVPELNVLLRNVHKGVVFVPAKLLQFINAASVAHTHSSRCCIMYSSIGSVITSTSYPLLFNFSR